MGKCKTKAPKASVQNPAALEDHIESNRTTLYDAHALIRASEVAVRGEDTDPAVLARTLHIAATMIETALEQLDIVSIRQVQDEAAAEARS